MKYLYQKLVFTVVLFGFSSIHAQTDSDKKIRAGLVANTGMNIITPGLVKKIDVVVPHVLSVENQWSWMCDDGGEGDLVFVSGAPVGAPLLDIHFCGASQATPVCIHMCVYICVEQRKLILCVYTCVCTFLWSSVSCSCVYTHVCMYTRRA